MKSFSFFLVALLSLVLMNCGDSSKSLYSSGTAETQSTKCILCHRNDLSTVTGAKIVDEWKLSSHNTKDGAGCYACHNGGNFQHPAEFSSVLKEFPNIEKSPKGEMCFSCHEYTLPKAHYAFYTSSGYHPAQYVSANYKSYCIACHNPHNPNPTTEHRHYARSGHGDVKGLAWSDRDFKDTVSCIRCHTSTGYIDYVTNNFTQATVTWAKADDNTREVLTCKACHRSYDFKNSVRTVPQYTAMYKENFRNSYVQFPDVSKSNICIPCHAGRESGQSVRAISDFTNASFKNPHYLAAAGVFYAKAGYHFYTSVAKYDNYANFGFNHSKIGMTGQFTTSTPVGSGTDGQCVGCHLGNGGTYINYSSHTLNPVYVARSTGSTGCYGCHSGENMAELIEEEKAKFDRGMDFFKYVLAQNGMFYADNYPYFFKTANNTSSANAIKNWTVVGPQSGDGVSGANNMGAAFNFKLLQAEKGAHVHNRSYARKLISHSIFYLQTGKDLNVVANRPASNTDPNKIINFSNYSAAYPTTLSDGRPVILGVNDIYSLKRWLLTGAPNYRLR
ncbi:MAG: hypothetical protein OHK0040_12540 [bacterium]